MKSILAASFVLAIIALTACVRLQPGASAFVVRVEQSQTMAKSSFDLVLNVDNSNRGFWKTNAPAFHSFCEWLRTPQEYSGQPVARCVAIQFNVDDLKLSYLSSRTTSNSNLLWSAWSILNTAVAQAQSWSTIITNK